jgi:hypothetical protein
MIRKQCEDYHRFFATLRIESHGLLRYAQIVSLRSCFLPLITQMNTDIPVYVNSNKIQYF